MTMLKAEKIQKTLKEDKVFLITETDKYEYYICKGIHGKVYEILHFKGNDRWKCNCGNVRNTPCYHIEAAMQVKENDMVKEDEEFSNMGNNTSNVGVHNI